MEDQQQMREFVLNNPTFQTIMEEANSRTNPNDDIYHQFLSTLPAGFRFKPRDEELITHYLDKKVHNKPLPRHNIIEIDLYKYNPQDLTAMYKPLGENEWYFFTPRDRKYPKGERPKRSTVDGFWKATGADKMIRKSSDKTEIGHMTTLVYYKGQARRGEKTEWIMREYRVDASKKEKGNKQLDNVVLCRLYKKTGKTSRKRKQNNVPTNPDDVKEDKADDKGPCNDMQTQKCFDAPSNMMMLECPISFDPDPGHQYQNNFHYLSADYKIDIMDPMNEFALSYNWPGDQNNFMMLNDHNFPADVDQNSVLLPISSAAPAPSQSALSIPPAAAA